MEGFLDFIPGLFCACLEVFPCLISGGLQLVQLCPGLILLLSFIANIIVDETFCFLSALFASHNQHHDVACERRSPRDESYLSAPMAMPRRISTISAVF